MIEQTVRRNEDASVQGGEWVRWDGMQMALLEWQVRTRDGLEGVQELHVLEHQRLDRLGSRHNNAAGLSVCRSGGGNSGMGENRRTSTHEKPAASHKSTGQQP